MKNKKNTDYDVIVIGGGLVGASLLAALKNQTDIKIAVVEAFEFASSSQPSFDDRSIALSYGSRRIWEAMGLWPAIEDKIAAIKSIHISDRGHLGVTRIEHTEERVEALGYVAENRVVGAELINALSDLQHIDWYCPAKIKTLQQQENQLSIEIESNDKTEILHTRLLVAADGAQSVTRQLAGIDIKQEDYLQSAVITNVQTDQSHQGVAYERFTENGPIAFLPMTENRYSIVWTCKREQAEELMRLDEKTFIAALQQAFGFRAGLIRKAGKRSSYPLMYAQAEQLSKGRVVVIGNAAHTLHPVAGQGYNLALRDVAELAELIVGSRMTGGTAEGDAGHPVLLAAYHEKRLQDMTRVYQMTDSMVKIFSTNFAPLGHARAMALIAVDLIPSLRSLLARQSMGLLGRMNKLQRRLSL